MKILKLCAVALIATALAACGGGDKAGSPSTVTTSKTTLNLQLKLQHNGQDVQFVTENDELDITATLTKTVDTYQGSTLQSSSTTPVSGSIVRIETAGGQLNPESGEVLTDDDGIAKAKLTVGDAAGAFALSASSQDISQTLNYQVEEILNPLLEIRISPDDTLDLIAGNDYNIQVQSLLISDYRLEIQNNIQVQLSSDGGTWSPSNGIVTTNDEGMAYATFRPGFVSGGFQLTATAEYDDQSVMANKPVQISVPEAILQPLFVDNILLSAGGTTRITAMLTDADGNPWLPVTEVHFNSICAQSGQAELTQTALSINGLVESTYHATGCSGTDVITATASIQGVALPIEQTAQIEILPAELGSIQFVETDPGNIQIEGSGGVEVATVTFKVLDELGNASPGVNVNFDLIGNGGVTLVKSSSISNQDGEVQAQVQSGTVATTVRVTAHIDGKDIETQSQQIVVSTGIPDQNSFSISFENLSPETWNYDGVENEIHIRAADHNNNWVPDGTQVYFWTEGGSIEPSCETTDGACTVLWISQNPRPENGRVTILARTVGDESFLDLNGNGLRDQNEGYTDLPEAFLDANENGIRDEFEEFADFNNDQQYNQANGRFDGLLCNSNCGQGRGVDVRESGVIVMATSGADIDISPDPIHVTNLSSRLVSVSVSDLNGNMMPAGTKVDLEATNGTLSGTSSYEIASTNSRGPAVMQVIVEADEESSTGLFIATVTSPNGVVTMKQVVITDDVVDPCSFSPVPPECLEDRVVSRITVDPADIAIDANEDAVYSVTVQVIDDNNLAIEGLQVAGECNASTADDMLANLGNIDATDTNGNTRISVRITTYDNPAGTVTCTFSAGEKSTNLRIQTRS